MANFRPIDRTTPYLLPPSVEDWLPKDHLARFVVDIVDQLDLSALTRQYRAGGSPAYHPSVMLGLLIYGYATGVYASRRIEAATHESIAFRYIAANEQPDHDSLCVFRKRFLKMLARAEAADQEPLPEGLSIPEELKRREDRLAAIRQARIQIEARAAERDAQEKADFEAKMKAREDKATRTGKRPGGKPPSSPVPGVRATDQINLTDADSRIMPATGKGFEQRFNAQAAVDADSGFFSAANVAHCVAAKMEPLLAAGRDKHHPHWEARFTEPSALVEPASAVERMKHKLKTVEGRKLYGMRKQTVEPVFGIIKSVMGTVNWFSSPNLGDWHRIVCHA